MCRGHRWESQLNRTAPFNVEDQYVEPVGAQAFSFFPPELPIAVFSTLKNAIRLSCGDTRLEARVLSNGTLTKQISRFLIPQAESHKL